MRSVLAIAKISLHKAVRSKVVVCLLLVLLLVIVCLPLTIKGDGTIQGQVQILLRYSLGFATLLLGIVTLWAGCASVSTEISERNIHMLLSKPVRRSQVWLGKWLGLVALNALMLIFCAGVVFGILLYRTDSKDFTEEEKISFKEQIWVARRAVDPVAADIDQMARQLFAEQVEAGAIDPAATHEKEVLKVIRNRLKVQRNSIAPGQQNVWRFALPEQPDPSEKLFVAYRISPTIGSQGDIPGLWQVTNSSDELLFQQDVVLTPRGQHSLEFPASVLRGEREIRVAFSNLAQHNSTLFLTTDNGIQVLYHYGSFGMNFLRSIILLFAELCLIAALGVTAGTLFALPVAAFTSISLVSLQAFHGFVSGFIEEDGGMGGEAFGGTGALEMLQFALYKLISIILIPLRTVSSPLDALATGILVPWSAVAAALLLKVALYSGVVGLFGIWFFNRREVGLPE